MLIDGTIFFSGENTNIKKTELPAKKPDRRTALENFLAEKGAQKLAIKKQQKPPFIVGISTHRSLSNKKTENKDTPTHKVRSQRVVQIT